MSNTIIKDVKILPPLENKYDVWYRFRGYVCENCISNVWEICDREDEMGWKIFVSAEKYNLIEAIKIAKNKWTNEK